MTNLSLLKEKMFDIKIGMTGYPYILDSTGKLIVHPKMEGTNIYDYQDTKGRYFIREICEKKNGTIIYPWKNPGELVPRDKIVIYKYVKELDWIIAVGSYLDEYYEPLKNLQLIIVLTILAVIIIAVVIVVFVSNSLSKPIGIMTENLFGSANQLESASNQVSSSSQELSSGASGTSFFR